MYDDEQIKELKDSGRFVHEVESLRFNLEAEFFAQKPESSIYRFEGSFHLNEPINHPNRAMNQVSPTPKNNEKRPLHIKNFLFKGTKIRNVDWIVGLVVYTGKDTKIQQNGSVSKNKISSLERLMHKMIIVLFLVQVFFSLLSSFGQSLLDFLFNSVFSKYFTQVHNTSEDTSTVTTILRYFVLLNTMIPISLLVNIEIVRMIQAIFISSSIELTSKERGM
jgi:magnesium-transporting ATPase (P-type)